MREIGERRYGQAIMALTAVSLFTGAGGMDLGFERAGIETVLQCDLFDASHLLDMPAVERRDLTSYGHALRGVLERHWPGVERVNDVRNVSGTGADLVHFGSPCQDLSVAGKQSGFVEGGRSNLFFEGVRVIRDTGPRFVVWENVVGALSSNGGRDFAAVLAALADAGAVDIAWRVLDAQGFGVPQRRRRVFVVADFGGERAAEILFEPESGARPAASGGAAREAPAYALTASVRGTGDGHGNAWNSNYVAPALRASGVGVERLGDTRGQDPVVMGALDTKLGDKMWLENQSVDKYGVMQVAGAGVRRLTPRECERLMGWGDDWTRWAADGREISDSMRYRMCGNGVVAPVAEWIGRRLVAVDAKGAKGTA